MLPALKVENQLSAADAPGTPAHTRYPWGDSSSSSGDGGDGGGVNRPESRHPEMVPFETPLPYAQPERLNRNESFFLPSPRSQITSGIGGVPTHSGQDLNNAGSITGGSSSNNSNELDRSQEFRKGFDGSQVQDSILADEQKYVDIQNLSSDGRAAERKKMKRFRLTHNQTRFLMSEFSRQAHPDAAHRERLSREIPGLSPRQVQVWFQNRRAKLKRLTGNDREKMLKSRALPEDFDTSQVLRSPFDGKSSPETVLPSPRNFMSPNPNPNSLKMLLTDGLPRSHADEYVVSPMSSASYISPATPDRNPDHFPPSAAYLNRASLSAPVTNLQRNDQGTFPFSRSNSCSDAYAQQQQQHHHHHHHHHQYPYGPHHHDRFSRTHSESFGHPGLPPVQHAVEYDMNRPSSAVVGGYDNRQQLGSPVVSPIGPSGHASVPYGLHSPSNMHMQGYQQHLSIPAAKPTTTIGELEIDPSQTTAPPQQPPSRHLSTYKPTIPVSSDPPPYHRPLSYHHPHPYTMNATMTFGGQPAAPNGLSTPFHPSDAAASAAAPPSASNVNVYNPIDERMHPAHAQLVDPSRANASFEYQSYM